MIIFTDNPSYIPYIQYQFSNRPVDIYNLSSLYSGYKDATDLLTKMAIINNSEMPMPEFVQSIQFDMQYASAIMNDPILFNKLMMILSAHFEGYIVVILVQRDPYRDAIMESLIKFIQQRYGYNCWIVEDIGDIECLKETPHNPFGLDRLNEDLYRYDGMNQTNGISVE